MIRVRSLRAHESGEPLTLTCASPILDFRTPRGLLSGSELVANESGDAEWVCRAALAAKRRREAGAAGAL